MAEQAAKIKVAEFVPDDKKAAQIQKDIEKGEKKDQEEDKDEN